MRIAIVGAGWYGCHLGLSLLQQGHQVKIFERSDRTISGASRYNQNRLHQGFHYPRDYETRRQSLEGFEWFNEHYMHLIEPVRNNLYAVANKKSNIDFETFKQIMTASNLKYDSDLDSAVIDKFRNIDGIINTTEMLILNHRASDYFNDILSSHIEFNKEIKLSDDNVLKEMKLNYDVVIDCTWGTSRKIPSLDYYYEPCIYFYYRAKRKIDFAFTLMDGNFFSVYPYQDDIYTVTSVKHTPIGQVFDREDIGELFRLARGEEFIKNKRREFEREIDFYYPGFLEDFEYVKPVYSLKTKLVSGTDYRGCMVTSEDNLISVFSGKIDTLHIAERAVATIISELRVD
ncbi:FAD-dependent oxidoreductase [Vibrio comitans]